MMNEKGKMNCDDLLKAHEMAQKFLGGAIADAAMLTTLIQMTRDGKDEIAMYMLHNLKSYVIDIAKSGEEKSEPEIDIDDLLSALLG